MIILSFLFDGIAVPFAVNDKRRCRANWNSLCMHWSN